MVVLRSALWAGFIALSSAAAQDPQDDIALITQRRVRDLSESADPTWFGSIPDWLAAQKDDGTWSDVDYATGCDARRANWPIQQHWNRLITFAAAWSGANPAAPANLKGDAELFAAISKGLDFWFDNDYTEPDCMGNGGLATGKCPCGTPGLWNTNWYGQAILIPQLCSTTCLLVKDGDLSDSQRAGCERIPLRSYLLRDQRYGTGGFMTGANMVLVMQNSVTLGLYMNNATILQDAFDRAMNEITLVSKPGEDGIHADGSFLQHSGILYNGNYGKDMLNAFIQLEGEAIGTAYAANDATRTALAAKVRGDEWMIYTDRETGRSRWDFNVIGRFVAFPTVDLQASADINFNTSKLAAATADFGGANNLNDTMRRLMSNGTEKLVGNKGFWASDYMVHRRESFVLANKMLSTRGLSSEAVNGANPYGYHLGQGTLFSYVTGNEYKDIMAAWDWNLVPGTTVLLNRPKLQTSTVKYAGKRDFVGVVSDGQVGTAVEDYVDPFDGSISYQKAWFFLGDSVLVTTANLKVNASVSPDVPVVTVLDNRAGGAGPAWVDGKKLSVPQNGAKVKAKTLFYGGNGYFSYDADFKLTLSDGDRTGNWSEISTSTVGVTTVPVFSAYTEMMQQQAPFTYALLPATTRHTLDKEAKNPSAVPLSQSGINGVAGSDTLSLVFWPGQAGSSITVDLRKIGWAQTGSVTVTSSQPGVYLLTKQDARPGKGKGMGLRITTSDPTQKLATAAFSVSFSQASVEFVGGGEVDGGASQTGRGVKFEVGLPREGMAGSSVSRDVFVRWGK